MEWKVAFTGHRPDKLGGYGDNPTGRAVKSAIRGALTERLAAHSSGLVVMSGMAQGTDQWAAEACVELGIPFIAALPCRGHSSRWPTMGKQNHERLLEKAKKIVYVTDAAYTPDCMQKRNRYMVDWCDELLAIWDGSPGGTFNCLRYAWNRHKEPRVKNLWQLKGI